MLTKIPRVVDLSKQVLSTDRGMANTRMMLPSGRAKKLAETVLGKKPMIPPSLAKASVAAGVTFGAGLPLGMADPKDVGATFAKMQVSLQDAFKQISDSVEDASKIPQFYFMQVQEGYNEEMQKQEAPEEIPPTIEEQALKPVSLMFAEGGELDMQGTPMAPDLSMEMQPDMADVSQAEMQEAQGALMQILQVINMLIEQGLSPEQIKAFLEQYGISEDELEQAAQALGVDIDMVLSGQMQAPQEPMMMAEGGTADVGSITPISPFEMTEAFGGPLYQMLNPGAQQLVDRFGLRGKGLAGFAAMAFGPKKVKGGLTALDDLTRGFLAKEKTRLEGVIKSIKEGTDPILKKENLAIYQKQLDDVNEEIAENIRLRKQYDEMVKDPSKFFKTKD